jgi:threonine aldolase
MESRPNNRKNLEMINLYSDTQTRPTPEMRQAIMAAPVGDEQKDEDPTVNRLLAMVAELLGKEAALFLPSGTMCNLIAVKTHTRPGDAMLVDRQGHILRFESGGAALASGVMVEQLPGVNGRFTPDDVLAAIPERSHYDPVPRLLCVEQTHNLGGGSIWPLDQLQAVAGVAHENGLAVHMDGARLMNAVVATGIAAHSYAESCDSVWIDFTKGLGAPVGAALAGSAGFIERARRYKHLFGGAMRQAGIIAAGCIYALEHHVERLQEDHENAQILANGLREMAGVEILKPVETNMVYFDTSGAGMSADDFLQRIEQRGVRMGSTGHGIRAVTHLDVDRAGVEQAIAIISEVVAY